MYSDYDSNDYDPDTDESEIESDSGLNEIDIFPIPNKGYGSFSNEEIYRKFESIVEDVEKIRTKDGTLPSCNAISHRMLIGWYYII